MIKSVSLCLAFFFLCLASCKSPRTSDNVLSSIPDPKTLGESYVSNPDHILSPSTVASLNAQLGALDQAGTAHIDVVFVNTIGDQIPKNIAHELFRKWKIGRKDTNNGLLILMVRDQKRIEFETGYGLEGMLPDMICKRIQEEEMVPHARNNDFDSAITSGVNALIARLQNDDQTLATSVPDSQPSAAPLISVPETSLPAADSAVASPSNDRIAPSSPLVNARERSQGPGLIALLTFLPLTIFYIAMAVVLGGNLGNYRFKHKWANPIVYFLVIVPPVLVIYISIIDPLPGFWFIIRSIALFYLFLLVYIHLHFLILSLILKSALKGMSRHDQYMKLEETHTLMEHAVLKIFPYPFLKFYWKTYKDRLYQLRHTAMDCEKCGSQMTCLDDEQEDRFLSKGQLSEERIDSIDYDVWECPSCKEHLILDYKNIRSIAKECPECHFITLKFDKRKIIKPSTTYSEGYGYIYSICANCKFTESVKFEIDRISTSSDHDSSSSSSFSSSSSSSSDSSSSSTSSGGSSGGGGAGSSW